MATFAQIRDGLAGNLRTVRFANGNRPNVSAYMQSNPIPPGIQVFPGPLTYDQAMRRGVDQPTWVVQAFVAFTSDVGSQTLLDEMCAPTGAGSVKTALEADKTLGAVVSALHVTGMSGYRIVDSGVGVLLVAEWDVTVWAQN